MGKDGYQKRFYLKFDEFFKLKCVPFFEFFGYRVETEVEIFKLPKKADVLIIESENPGRTSGFRIFRYWKKYNLLSYKAPDDRIRLKDIADSILYHSGYVNLQKGARWDNTTITLIGTGTPIGFLKKYGSFVKTLGDGHLALALNLFEIHILDLRKIPPGGLDALYLLNFGPRGRLPELAKTLKRPARPQNHRGKILDRLREVLYTRILEFEPELESNLEDFMATSMKIDVTDLVKPYYDKGVEEGKLEGKAEGKLEDARMMHGEGMEPALIRKITGLTEEQLRKAGILS